MSKSTGWIQKYLKEENFHNSNNKTKKSIWSVCVYIYLFDYPKHSELESVMLQVLLNV